jgi:hypothetical protein
LSQIQSLYFTNSSNFSSGLSEPPQIAYLLNRYEELLTITFTYKKSILDVKNTHYQALKQILQNFLGEDYAAETFQKKSSDYFRIKVTHESLAKAFAKIAGVKAGHWP